MYWSLKLSTLAGWLSWLEHRPNTPRLQVQSLVRAHPRSNQQMHKHIKQIDVSLKKKNQYIKVLNHNIVLKCFKNYVSWRKRNVVSSEVMGWQEGRERARTFPGFSRQPPMWPRASRGGEKPGRVPRGACCHLGKASCKAS